MASSCVLQSAQAHHCRYTFARPSFHGLRWLWRESGPRAPCSAQMKVCGDSLPVRDVLSVVIFLRNRTGVGTHQAGSAHSLFPRSKGGEKVCGCALTKRA